MLNVKHHQMLRLRICRTLSHEMELSFQGVDLSTLGMQVPQGNRRSPRSPDPGPHSICNSNLFSCKSWLGRRAPMYTCNTDTHSKEVVSYNFNVPDSEQMFNHLATPADTRQARNFVKLEANDRSLW